MPRTKKFSRDEALQEALKLFWNKGYHATSTKELEDHMKIGRSSLYDTFGDKHSLFLEAMRRYQSQYVQQQIKKYNESTDIREAIADMFADTVQDIICNTKAGCFFVNTSTELAAFDQEVEKILMDNGRDLQEALHHKLEEARSLGLIGSEKDTLAITHFIMNTVNGMRVAGRTSAPKAYFDNVVKMALSVL